MNGVMKYIEELKFGEIFLFNNKPYIKTTDFKQSKNIQYLCVSIDDGKLLWLNADNTVVLLDLYKRDDDGNIIPIKIYSNNDNNFSKT